MKRPNIAQEIMKQVSAVAVENRDLRRQIKAVRHHASAGLHQAGEEGAVRWRDALDKILEVTARR